MRALTILSLMLAACLPARPAQAEYRVYELSITDSESQSTRAITSTLDPVQYSGYYPVQATESIRIQNTWMCWGRADYYAPYCDDPRPAPKAK